MDRIPDFSACAHAGELDDLEGFTTTVFRCNVRADLWAGACRFARLVREGTVATLVVAFGVAVVAVPLVGAVL